MTAFLCIVLGYVLGSAPWGLVIARTFCGIDPRNDGSRNTGATNVARLCGFRWGVLTLACDLGKGALPVALALWPHAAARRPVQQVARDMGLDVLLHMPMEAMPRKNGTAPNPGPGALETDMDAYAMEHALDKALAQVPTALGFNNHMGSGFTGRRDACRMLAGLAYGRGLFVLDSVTRGNSQLETSMVRQGIVTASRHVFLDDPQGTDKVLAALDKAARLARKQGIAIAIGHPHASTLRALERWENREGVAVVPLRRYVWHLAQLRAGQFGKSE